MVSDVCNQLRVFSGTNSPLLPLDLENEGNALSQKAGEYLLVDTSKNGACGSVVVKALRY
jgi:hypothetical protein